ncbi:2-dehydropantoate 2-reductase (plasmid) [Rhizobium sp. WL3]|uniref:ketopantoate reductase family protein n=1 Tax=Rhizobium sp. WL3 TaxID=2603277 RepID=UPI0011C1E5E3|nr:2-dehydropantoate 2-reductase [Rhizobium sp. WL3]QEE43172.1 2-dehydropantoate 2-reductase [Rhizobium sp. WL3]
MDVTISSQANLKICVAGPGAIGISIATLLAAAGEKVTVIARGDSYNAIASSGLNLRLVDGDLQTDVSVSDGSDIGIQDVLFLCSKSQDLLALVNRSRTAIGAETMVVPVVNGIPWWYFHGLNGRHAGRAVTAVDPLKELATVIPTAQTVGAVASFTSERLAPGRAVALNPLKMVIGEIDDVERCRSRVLVDILNRCGIETRLSTRIRDPLWTKVIANLMSNPLSVVAEAPLKHVCGGDDLSIISRKLIDEAMLVAASFGARLEVDPNGLLEFGAGMGDAKTSMLQDFQSGRQLELDAICGAVLELASIHGIDMPLTTYISGIARYKSITALSRPA